jgi:hypothetical protein
LIVIVVASEPTIAVDTLADAKKLETRFSLYLSGASHLV